MTFTGLFLLGILVLSSPAGGSDDPAGPDKLVLQDGKTVQCTVLDLSDEEVVIRVKKRRVVVPRAKISDIERPLPSGFEDFFQKQAANTTNAEGWRKLAGFCEKKGARVEHRECLREILKLEPDDRDAHLALGHAQLEGGWLSEQEVAAKIQEGYDLEDGELVPSARLVMEKENMNADHRSANGDPTVMSG